MHHLCTPKDRDAGQDRSGANSWAQLRWWLMIKHVKATLTEHRASLRVAQVREKISSQQQIMKQIKAPWGLCQPGEPGSLECSTRVLQSHFDGTCFLQATLCKLHKHAVDFPVSTASWVRCATVPRFYTHSGLSAPTHQRLSKGEKLRKPWERTGMHPECIPSNSCLHRWFGQESTEISLKDWIQSQLSEFYSKLKKVDTSSQKIGRDTQGRLHGDGGCNISLKPGEWCRNCLSATIWVPQCSVLW